MMYTFDEVARERMRGLSSGTFDNYVQVLLSTGLLNWIFIAMVAFAIDAAVIAFAMDTFLPGLAEDPRFPGSLSDIALLVGYVYFIWLNQNLTGFEAPLKSYWKFLQRIRTTAVIVSSRTSGKEAQQGNCVLRYMVLLGDRLHRPGPTVAELTDTDAQKMADINDDKTLNDMIRFQMCTQLLIAEDSKNANGPSPMLSSVLLSAIEDVNSIEAGGMVRAPIVMETHIAFFVVLWFGIWLPITMWARFGVFQTIAFYPVIMFILSAIAIYRAWLGSPWSSMRPIRGGEHESWPDMITGEINGLFDNRALRLVGSGHLVEEACAATTTVPMGLPAGNVVTATSVTAPVSAASAATMTKRVNTRPADAQLF